MIYLATQGLSGWPASCFVELKIVAYNGIALAWPSVASSLLTYTSSSLPPIYLMDWAEGRAAPTSADTWRAQLGLATSSPNLQDGAGRRRDWRSIKKMDGLEGEFVGKLAKSSRRAIGVKDTRVVTSASRFVGAGSAGRAPAGRHSSTASIKGRLKARAAKCEPAIGGRGSGYYRRIQSDALVAIKRGRVYFLSRARRCLRNQFGPRRVEPALRGALAPLWFGCHSGRGRGIAASKMADGIIIGPG